MCGCYIKEYTFNKATPKGCSKLYSPTKADKLPAAAAADIALSLSS